MTLEVEICTYGLAGLQRVAQMTLPAVEGVRYRICMQNPDGAEVSLPEALLRPDVDFFQHPTRGLSINRNAALDRAEADIILIADDDIHYRAEGLRAVIDTFVADPSLDFATFKFDCPSSKPYPKKSIQLKVERIRRYTPCSIEIALRRKSIPQSIRFSPQAGIGAPVFSCAEENLFLQRLLLHGLNGRFFPITICEHPNEVTCVQSFTPATLRGFGLLMWIQFRHSSFFQRTIMFLPRVIVRALFIKASMFRSIYYMIAGYLRAGKYFNDDLTDRV